MGKAEEDDVETKRNIIRSNRSDFQYNNKSIVSTGKRKVKKRPPRRKARKRVVVKRLDLEVPTET